MSKQDETLTALPEDLEVVSLVGCQKFLVILNLNLKRKGIPDGITIIETKPNRSHNSNLIVDFQGVELSAETLRDGMTMNGFGLTKVVAKRKKGQDNFAIHLHFTCGSSNKYFKSLVRQHVNSWLTAYGYTAKLLASEDSTFSMLLLNNPMTIRIGEDGYFPYCILMPDDLGFWVSES